MPMFNAINIKLKLQWKEMIGYIFLDNDFSLHDTNTYTMEQFLLLYTCNGM